MQGWTLLWPVACLVIAAALLQSIPGAHAGEAVLTLEVGSARLALAREDIEDAAHRLTATDLEGLEISLVPAKARALEKFTATFVGEQIVIRFGNQVLSSPHIMEPIANGGFTISPISREDARAIIDMLN